MMIAKGGQSRLVLSPLHQQYVSKVAEFICKYPFQGKLMVRTLSSARNPTKDSGES